MAKRRDEIEETVEPTPEAEGKPEMVVSPIEKALDALVVPEIPVGVGTMNFVNHQVQVLKVEVAYIREMLGA